MKSQNPLRAVALSIVATGFVAAALSFLIPIAPGVSHGLQAHLRTAAGVVLAVVFCGAAVWFWRGLQHFKTRLRLAYILLGIGMVLFGAAMIQVPIFGLFNLWNTAWATGGGAILVFIFSAVPMYLGMRQLAILSGAHNLATRIWFVVGVAVVTAVVAIVVSPHFIRHNMVGAPIYVGAVYGVAVFIFFAGLNTTRAKQALGPSYARPLQTQAQAFYFLALCAFNEATVVTFMPRTDTFYSVYGIYLWTFMIDGFLFVRACYYFHRLTAAYTPVIAAGAPAITDQDYIDSIVNVANLASRAQDISPILDDMRQVTARRTAQQALSAADKKRLLDVYHRLEQYLLASDPLRTFTPEQLGDYVTPAFSQLLQKA